jgi:mitochondrial cardiolipin hydrolase
MIWIILSLFVSSSMHASYCALTQSSDQEQLLLAQAAPEGFGKTHFIVGQPTSIAETVEQVDVPQLRKPKEKASVRSYFSPDDDVKKKLLKLIQDEKKSIRAAVFILTEPDIARALSRAQKRGVKVELITDVGCLKERANKMSMLCDSGCTLFVYNPPEPQKGSSLMHHKFALFETPKMVWTGSYNFTKAASNSNQENAVSIADQKTYENFVRQFERVKSRSYRYGKPARA